MSLLDYARKLPLGRLRFVDDGLGGGTTQIRKAAAPLPWIPISAVAAAAMVIIAVAAHQHRPGNELAMLQQAASDGDAGAELQLGLAYRDGRLGLAPDAAAGSYWIHRAARAGNGYAARMDAPPADGDSASASVTTALRGLLRNADPGQQSPARLLARAEAGDALAQYQLAMRYRDGSWGVNADAEQARLWLERAAQNGNRAAMESLANAYRNGQLGLAPNAAKAQSWQARARSEG